MSRHVACRENVIQRLPLHRCDVSNSSASQFGVRATGSDAGEFRAYFPADDSHCVIDDDDVACYNDHYDDNYQVVNSQYLFLTIAVIMILIDGLLISNMTVFICMSVLCILFVSILSNQHSKINMKNVGRWDKGVMSAVFRHSYHDNSRGGMYWKWCYGGGNGDVVDSIISSWDSAAVFTVVTATNSSLLITCHWSSSSVYDDCITHL